MFCVPVVAFITDCSIKEMETKSQGYVDIAAMENGYEQVFDPETKQVLWKKTPPPESKIIFVTNTVEKSVGNGWYIDPMPYYHTVPLTPYGELDPDLSITNWSHPVITNSIDMQWWNEITEQLEPEHLPHEE